MKLLLFTLLSLNITLGAHSQTIDRATLLSDIKILSSERFEGRKTGTAGNRLAANYISERFKSLGLDSYRDSFYHDFKFANRQKESTVGRNVIGYIKGRTDKVIVVSAHYDHLGKDGAIIYYGADDNASGVAAILSFAAYFSRHPPLHTLLFVAFDAEESGLRGASEFINKSPVNRSNIVLNVNMDMISHNDKGELYAAGTFQNPSLRKFIEDQATGTGIRILFSHDSPDLGKDDWTMQSDHGSFAKAGIPFIYFGVEDHKDYHKPTDTFENINQEFYFGAATAILKSITKLMENPAWKDEN